MIRQSSGIFLISVIIGLAVNQLHPQQIASRSDWDICFVSRCRVQVARELFDFFRIMITLLL